MFNGTNAVTAESIRQRLTPNNILQTIDNVTVGEISNKLPSKVERNAIFLFDAHNYTLKDITADELGCFDYDSTSGSDYELLDDWVCTRKKYKGKVNRDSLKTATNVVVKTYYYHKTHTDYQRVAAYVETNRQAIKNNVVFMAYLFEGDEHHHGNNRKQCKGYINSSS